MSDKEILEKAINLAIDGGCTYFDTEHFLVKHYIEGMEDEPGEWPSINDIIFNHDFARALWSDKELVIEAPEFIYAGDYAASSAEFNGPTWIYYLQQMVIVDDPIAYLGANI